MTGGGSWDDCNFLQSVLALVLAHVLAPDPAHDSVPVPVPAPALSLALASAAEEPWTLDSHRTVRAAVPAGLLAAAAARSTAVVAVGVAAAVVAVGVAAAVVAVVVLRNCTLVGVAVVAAPAVVDAAAVVGRPGYPVTSPEPDPPADHAV
jgi:hypothetical protein